MDLKENDILGHSIVNHWYYKSKAAAALRLIGDNKCSVIVDVGAGSGYFSRYFLRNTSVNEAWCVDINYDSDSDSMEANKPIHFRRDMASVDADLVLVMDVLEHVDDDIGLLVDYIKKLSSGTLFLISVPAFSFLWSDHDVFLEHKRRYTLSQLESVVCQSGLSVINSSYYYGAVFPIAVASRLLARLTHRGNHKPRSQMQNHSQVVNKILYELCRTELSFLPKNKMFGLTAFCLAVVP